MNFFEVIKTIYNKSEINFKVDNSLNHTLTKWLSYDKQNLESLRSIVGYYGQIRAERYFRLLYLGIPKGKPPYLGKVIKTGNKCRGVFQAISKVFSWSDRECELQKNILEKVIDIKYWKRELGVK